MHLSRISIQGVLAKPRACHQYSNSAYNNFLVCGALYTDILRKSSKRSKNLIISLALLELSQSISPKIVPWGGGQAMGANHGGCLHQTWLKRGKTFKTTLKYRNSWSVSKPCIYQGLWSRECRAEGWTQGVSPNLDLSPLQVGDLESTVNCIQHENILILNDMAKQITTLQGAFLDLVRECPSKRRGVYTPRGLGKQCQILTSDLQAWVRHPSSEIGWLERGFRWGSDGEVRVRQTEKWGCVCTCMLVDTHMHLARHKFWYIESRYRIFKQGSLVRTVWLVGGRSARWIDGRWLDL